MWIGWSDLDARALKALDPTAFERFVRGLVDVEAGDRWGPSEILLEGPWPAQDGGCDVLVTARSPARTDAQEHARSFGLATSLLGDLKAGEQVAFSCKTGETWPVSLQNDARDGSGKVLPVLRDGGRLVVVTSESLLHAPPRKKKAKKPPGMKGVAPPSSGPSAQPGVSAPPARAQVIDELVKTYTQRPELAGCTMAQIASRITLLTADELVDALRRRRPIEMDASLLETIGVKRSGALWDHAHWQGEHRDDRAGPAFVGDRPRQELIAQVATSVAPEAGGLPLVLVGAPGVGETRAVIEALARANISARVAVSDDPEEVTRLLRDENLLRDAPTLVLVVDDCPGHKVDGILRAFAAAQRDEPTATRARLLVIVPHGAEDEVEVERPCSRLQLAPLEADSRRALIRSELGSDEATVDAVDRVTEGYPWFAILVAREVRDGEDELRREVALRRPVVDALYEMALAPGRFAAVDAALFRLRLCENEAVANNASAVWEWLFLPWADLGDAPWAQRFEALAGRCRAGTARARGSAVAGLGALVTPMRGVLLSRGRGLPEPDVTEATARLEACWSLLIACASDADAAVSDVAQGAVVRSLRPAIERGALDAFGDLLAQALPRFSDPWRAALRREVDLERVMKPHAETRARALWETVRRATRPETYAQRLQERLSADGAASLVDEGASASLDEEVIREGIASHGDGIIGCLDRFMAPDAQRAGALMNLAGRLDADGVLADALSSLARTSRDAWLLTTWGYGQWTAGREERVRALLRAWRDDPEMATATVELMARVGFDDAWLLDAASLIAGGAVREAALRALENSSWSGVTPTTRRRLWSALLAREDAFARRVVLARFARWKDELAEEDLDLLSRAFRSQARQVSHGHVDWALHRCGRRLLDAGRVAVVCEAALTAATHEELPDDGVWALLGEVADRYPEALWRAMEPLLTAWGAAGQRLALRLKFHDLLGRLPANAIMAWVGGEERRAQVIAAALVFRGGSLPPIARELLVRFGAAGAVARTLTSEALSTADAVPSMAAFYRERRAAALGWAATERDPIRRWANETAERLRRAAEAEDEDDALDRRRYGT